MQTEVYAFGGKVNRFLHVCQSQEEVIERAQLGQFFTPHHGACIGARCAGTGALNSLYATTYEMDKKLGTDYHDRFV